MYLFLVQLRPQKKAGSVQIPFYFYFFVAFFGVFFCDIGLYRLQLHRIPWMAAAAIPRARFSDKINIRSCPLSALQTVRWHAALLDVVGVVVGAARSGRCTRPRCTCFGGSGSWYFVGAGDGVQTRATYREARC